MSCRCSREGADIGLQSYPDSVSDRLAGLAGLRLSQLSQVKSSQGLGLAV